MGDNSGMASVGSILLVLAAACAAAGLALGVARPKAGRLLRGCQVALLPLAAGAFGALAWVTATFDPTVAYAVLHRAPAGAPWGYRIAAVWAGQSGGLLLWAFETALIALALRPARQPRAVAVVFAIEACLLGLATVDRPFAPAPAGMQGGLNPMLRHPMMLIHPPMLFLGYALLAVPYAVTLGALIDNTPGQWRPLVQPWLLLSALALSVGNGLGGSWAYRTFGWGGFWGWDPVENTSFVPWALSLAAAHGVYLAGRRPRWLLPAAACSLLAFVAVLYGSFLARSGLLAGASVHAYVAGERLFEYALGGLFAAAATAGLAMLAARRRWAVEVQPAAGLGAVSGGTGVLIAIALVVLVGMSLPMAGLVPTIVAYNGAVMPLAAVMLACLAWWTARGMSPLGRAALGALGGLALGSGGVFVLGRLAEAGPWGKVVEPAVAAALGMTAVMVAAGSVWLLVRGRAGGAAISHLGLALLVLGALVSGYGTWVEGGYVATGETVRLAGHRVGLSKLTPVDREVLQADLLVDGRPARVRVERNQSFNIELRHPSIGRRWWGDVYVTPSALVPRPMAVGRHTLPPGAMLEVAVKPGMPLVWLGMALIGVGLLAAWVRRMKGVG